MRSVNEAIVHIDHIIIMAFGSLGTFGNFSFPRKNIIGTTDVKYDYADAMNGFVRNTASGNFDGELMAGAVTRAGTRSGGAAFELNFLMASKQFLKTSGLFSCRATNGFGMATWFRTGQSHSTFIEVAAGLAGNNTLHVYLSFGALSVAMSPSQGVYVRSGVTSPDPDNSATRFQNTGWHHVVWNIHADGTWTIFINKVLRITESNKGVPPPANRYVKLGTADSLDRNNFFNGQLQNTIVRFNSTFSTEEILLM